MMKRFSLFVTLLLWALSSQTAVAQATKFQVTLSSEVAEAPKTGRLFVLLSTQQRGEPRMGPNWFRPEPFFGLNVTQFKPGDGITIDDSADGFPGKLSELKPGRYRVQAVLDHSFYHQHHGKAPGNFYSRIVEADLDPAQTKEIPLVLDHVVPERKFQESKWVKEVTIRSELLSRFHGREVLDRAAVVLPHDYYDQPEKRYPVMYVIPGFSGTHYDVGRYAEGVAPPGRDEVAFIRVMLSGNCKWGHHVYADSATNGPRGQALVSEMIPHIDQTFRTVGEPTARFLNGHSSGGWSSLWLQVAYPDTFGGVWSTSPDPVSFHDYQQVNLYADPPQSLYRDERGQRRPIARRGSTPVLWYDSFGKMDDCLDRGGQLRSFEAVFSPLDEDGLPRKLWDRQTGRVDPQVAKAWEKYDIRLILQRNWDQLGPKLAGKLHVTTGSLDTFYLEGAVGLLQQTLKQLDSDAEITILAGADHGSLLTAELYQKIRRQMTVAYLKHHSFQSSSRE